jgi:CelD/BcsL family acetyltransferase involved in cellulose biosynthesis
MEKLLKEARAKDYYLKETNITQPSFNCPYKDVPPPDADLLMTINTNFRTELRSKTKLCDAEGVVFSVRDYQTDQDTALKGLLNLHTKRYVDKDGESKFNTPAAASFHQSLITSSGGKDLIYFFELNKGDTPIATLYGFLNKKHFSYYQISFDPENRKYSPGALLIYKVLQYWQARGIEKMDFLRGNEPYKAKWTTTRSRDSFIIYHQSFMGKLSQKFEVLKRLQRRNGRLQGIKLWFQGDLNDKSPQA